MKSDGNSMIIKNESSVASTAMISKYLNENNQSPIPNLAFTPGVANGSNQNMHQMQQTAALISDSDSSYSGFDNKKAPRSSGLPSKSHTKTNSQTSKQSKSRNDKPQLYPQTVVQQNQDSVDFADNAMLQEGINALFSKSKKKPKDKRNKSPFLTNCKTIQDKPQQAIDHLNQSKGRKSSKTKKTSTNHATVPGTKKEKSKSLKRPQYDKQLPKPNFILPNAQKLDKLQKMLSFELEQQPQLSMSSSNHEADITTINNQRHGTSFGEGRRKILTQSENNYKVIQQGRALQMIVSYIKHQTKDEKRRYFEKWRFLSLAQRSSVQILAQTRWVNEIQSVRTDSELGLQSKQRDLVLRKGIACLFRYRSRRMASMFQQWKYKVQFMQYMQNYLLFKMCMPNAIGLNDSESRRVSDARPGLSPSQQQRQIKSHIDKSSRESEDLENINESEDSAEKAISKQKKMGLMQNKTVGRQSHKEYNFNNPTADLEQLPYQMELFKQILQSPNKDFGRLMKHQSDCSIQYYNDNIVNDEGASSRRVSLFQNNTVINHQQEAEQVSHKSQSHLQILFAMILIKKKLENQVREVLREWRRETDRYVQSLNFKIKQKEMNMKKHVVKKLTTIRVINNSALLRHLQIAFNSWKMTTFVEKKAENRKLQMYFINNAKVEVQRSKQVLQKLYQQKQIFDEEQKLVERSRSASPESAAYGSYTSPNQQYGVNSFYNSQQSFGPNGSQRLGFGNSSPGLQFTSQSQMQQNSQPTNFSSQNIMQLMNPYFKRNQHALPQKLQQIVNQKSSQFEVVNQIKSLCYDMLLDILEEAEKNSKSPNAN